MTHISKVRAVPGRYAVARLPVGAGVPGWLDGPGFRAVVFSDDETTLVCREERLPPGVEAETGWACLRTVGPFPFEAAGVVQALIEPISSKGIGVFVVCTFDGEHVLIPAAARDRALRCLTAAGHDCGV